MAKESTTAAISTTVFSDPFHLHPSDHPGASLVTKLLNSDNYGTWSRSISIALSAKNKTGFVDGSIPKPLGTDAKFADWKRCNDMVLSWILNSIDPSISDSVIYTEHASAVWTDLKERFSQSNAPRIFQLQREIVSLQQNTLSVTLYYSKLKGLWDELNSYSEPITCSCGASCKIAEKDQANKVMQFLMGLNDSYFAIRGQILLLQPLPSIGKIYAMILQEEKQRDLTIVQEVMMVEGAKPGNNSRDKLRNKLHCTHCDRNNHTVDRCFFLHGFPSNNKSYKRGEKNTAKGDRPRANNTQAGAPALTTEQYQQLMNLLSNSNDEPQANTAGQFFSSPGHKWIIDTGATDHITGRSELLQKKKTSQQSHVGLPDGHKALISCTGLARINAKTKVPDVLHVPSFHVNLLSVSKLTKSLNCSLTFYPDFCVLQDLETKKMIGLGKLANGLYYLTSETSPSSKVISSVNHVNNHVTSTLWHQRLGHPAIHPLNLLSRSVLGISSKLKSFCEVCHFAKQTRLPFGHSSIKTKAPFDLIHCDIWGAFRVPSISGAHYFLTIVDDFSRHTWVYLMRHKSETQGLLRNFFAQVQTQFNTSVKCLRADNGMEFTSIR